MIFLIYCTCRYVLLKTVVLVVMYPMVQLNGPLGNNGQNVHLLARTSIERGTESAFLPMLGVMGMKLKVKDVKEVCSLFF